MDLSLAQLLSLWFLTFLLLSPFIVVPFFLSTHLSAVNSSIAVPTTFDYDQYQSSHSKKSQFALLIVQPPLPKVLGVEVTRKVVEESEAQTENSSPTPSRPCTIAVLGDSMIDVMQPDLPQLRSALQKYYPNTQFKLLNYGVGASNIESGLERLTSEYTYLEKHFPALLSQNPEIIVIESFAYNHGENNQSGLDRQWLALAKMIETIKKQSRAKIVLAATIAPDENTLCDGIDGLNLPPEQKREKARTIRAYLQNLINFASSEEYPLADAYHPSLDKGSNGQAVYINPGDHLHPSGAGGKLFAQEIAKAIYKNNLL